MSIKSLLGVGVEGWGLALEAGEWDFIDGKIWMGLSCLIRKKMQFYPKDVKIRVR